MQQDLRFGRVWRKRLDGVEGNSVQIGAAGKITDILQNIGKTSRL
jgi:hypothetical protein